MRLLGQLIAWYAVWRAWKRRGQEPPPLEGMRLNQPFSYYMNLFEPSERPPEWFYPLSAVYDVEDPADIKWGPGISPPLPRYITAGRPARVVWRRP